MKKAKIKIFGKAYKLMLVNPESLDNMFGRVCSGLGTIEINSAISKDNCNETIIHEALHVINDELLKPIKKGLKEEHVALISTGIYEFIQNNKLNFNKLAFGLFDRKR